MEVTFSAAEVDFLKELLPDKGFADIAESLKPDEKINLDDDIEVDEIRELCGDEECFEVYEAERQGVKITPRGQVACDLVDKLYQ